MTHRQYFKAVDPAVLCPISGFVDTNNPTLLGEACIIGGYIPDPTIPIPNADIDTVIANPGLFIPTNTYRYLLFVFDKRLSANAIFATGLGTASENIVLDMAGNTIATNANNLATFNLNSYVGDVIAIRLRFATGVNITIQPSQPTSFQCTGLIGIVSSVQSANITCVSQIYLKRILFLAPLINITTLNFTGCTLLYDIIWADTSFAYLITAAGAFYGCGFRKLITLPSMPALTSAYQLIYGCLSLEEFNTPFNLSTILNVGYMMYNTPKLKTINGVGVGGTLTWDFPAIVTGYNVYYLFYNCGFDGTVKIGLANPTTQIGIIFELCPNIKHIEFLSLSAATNAAIAALIKQCKSLISVTFPDSYLGPADIIYDAISGNFDSLEEVQFPMNDDPSAYYSAYTQSALLASVVAAPKLKVIRGRLREQYTAPPFVSSSVGSFNSFTLTITEGKYPSLEEVDYPLLPFSIITINYCNLKKFTSKIFSTNPIVFQNCILPPEEVAVILSNTVPWQINSNSYKNVSFIGNGVSLPIYYATSITAQTVSIYEDTWKALKSGSAGIPLAGMKHARSLFISMDAGTIGNPIRITQNVQQTTTQALPIGTRLIFIGSYSNQAGIATANAAGLPSFQNLYITSATVNAGSITYEISTTLGGSPITHLTDVVSALSLNFRMLLEVINVTSDASYWYITHNLSTFNYQSAYNNGLSAIFGDPIDAEVMLFLNRGLLY